MRKTLVSTLLPVLLFIAMVSGRSQLAVAGQGQATFVVG